MATIPQTFNFGGGDKVGNFTGVANDTAIPWIPPNPNDLGDIPIGNAALQNGCACEFDLPAYLDLDASTDLFNDITMLFHGRPLEQFLPLELREKNPSNKCSFAPTDSLQNTVHFHVFDNAALSQHARRLKDDPSLNHDRINIRDIPNNPTLLSQRVDILGYTHLTGDAPGYGKGRQISFESGKIRAGVGASGDFFSSTQISSFEAKKASDGSTYYHVDMPSGIYIHTLVIEFQQGTPNGKNYFHIAFKYNIDNPSCGADAKRFEQILKHETMIDNVANISSKPKDKIEPQDTVVALNAGASPQDVFSALKPKTSYTAIDCRFSTADYIELWGMNGVPKKVTVHYMTPQVYYQNVLKTNSFCSGFDRNNRMFVFYEDPINFTELPYVDTQCLAPSSSSSSSSSASLPPPTTSGGGGSLLGGGGGGGGGGSGGGGSGIPGNAPQPITYSRPSSSSSSSSSTSDGGTPVNPPTPPGAPDTIPPPAPREASGKVDINQNGNAIVTLTIVDGSTLPGTESTQTGPPGNGGAVSYNIYWATDPSGPFTKIGSTDTLSFTHDNPVENTWNYYRITAVDAAGNESQYLLFSIFVVKPKNCEMRNCAGCSPGYTSKNGFTVFFSTFSASELAFTCETCDPDAPSFVRILPEAFYEKDLDANGNKVPVKFSLLPNCQDADISQECTWTNTFYVPALVQNAKGYGCLSGFEKVLVPLKITLYQRAGSGWILEAYGIGPECQKMPIFETDYTLSACQQPARFLNKLSSDFSSASGTDKAERSTATCAIYPPDAYRQNTGTISVAMSPDYGVTWYQFRGIINIRQDRRAVKPFIAYDARKDIFHLFYIERDYSDENARGQAATDGFTANLCHVVLEAGYFRVEDAFKSFLPSPSISDLDSSSSSKTLDAFATSQMGQFSRFGQSLRNKLPQYVLKEEYHGADTDLTLLQADCSAYMDNLGRLWVIRNGESGTLVDPPDRLTRRRRKKAVCGNFTWAVSGITDTDCGCQSLLGSFTLELNSKTANYESDKWTLSVSSDYKYWEMTHNDGSINSLMVFRKKRNLSLCPPEGQYTLMCNRCAGEITGTLQSERVSVYGNGVLVDNDYNIPAHMSNHTDFGQVPIGFQKDQQFVIANNRRTSLELTGTPLVSIVGANADEFSVEEEPSPSIDANGSTTFTIRFFPKPENCVDPSDPSGIRNAQVKIQTNDSATGTYSFNLTGRCVPSDPNAPSDITSNNILNNFASGAVFSADAVGEIILSADDGNTWQIDPNHTEGIKTGQKANSVWDPFQNALYNIYIVDDMLFLRRYPALLHTSQGDQTSVLDQPFDGFNIIQDPQILIPNTDVLQGGMPASMGDLLNMPTYFDLPNIQIPGDILDTFEEDLRSKKTILINEKDKGGLPVFLSGNRQGALINAYFPYTDNYVFNDTTAVALARPAVAVTKSGAVRFFYVDINGNVNGGTISGVFPRLDTKMRVNNV